MVTFAWVMGAGFLIFSIGLRAGYMLGKEAGYMDCWVGIDKD